MNYRKFQSVQNMALVTRTLRGVFIKNHNYSRLTNFYSSKSSFLLQWGVPQHIYCKIQVQCTTLPHTVSVLSATPWNATCCRSYSKGKDRKKDKVKNVVINEGQLSQVVNVEDLRQQYKRVIDKMKEDFVKNFTLRTSLGVLDTLPIAYDGQNYTLQDLAQIGRKTPAMYVVDLSTYPQVLPDVLKAIKQSGLGLNPQQDGTTLFIPVPKLTREHRESLIKGAKANFVKVKDNLRDIQIKVIKGLKNRDGLSEDVMHSVKDQIVAITDQKIAEAEALFNSKQEELKG